MKARPDLAPDPDVDPARLRRNSWLVATVLTLGFAGVTGLTVAASPQIEGGASDDPVITQPTLDPVRTPAAQPTPESTQSSTDEGGETRRVGAGAGEPRPKASTVSNPAPEGTSPPAGPPTPTVPPPTVPAPDPTEPEPPTEPPTEPPAEEPPVVDPPVEPPAEEPPAEEPPAEEPPAEEPPVDEPVDPAPVPPDDEPALCVLLPLLCG